MTTIAILFFSIILLGASAVGLACWSAERKTRNEFRRAWKKKPTQAERDRARLLAGSTLKKIHP